MYATAEDMRAKYGEAVLVQITDTPSWGQATIDALNVGLADAAALIDGYVAKYYAPAPGAAIPPLLRRLNREIAFADLQNSPSEEASKKRAEAVRTLVDISKGLVKLDEGRADLPARDGAIIVTDPGRVFNRESLKGF